MQQARQDLAGAMPKMQQPNKQGVEDARWGAERGSLATIEAIEIDDERQVTVLLVGVVVVVVVAWKFLVYLLASGIFSEIYDCAHVFHQ
jgi:hypothetical protein